MHIIRIIIASHFFVLSTLCISNGNSLFEQIHDDIQASFEELRQELAASSKKMHDDYERMHHELMNAVETNRPTDGKMLPSPSLSLDASPSGITAHISNIAHYAGYVRHCDENDMCYGLDISADDTVIKLHYIPENHYLEALLTYESGHTEEGKKNKQKIAYKKTIQQGITVPAGIDLSAPLITYDEKQQLLTIGLHPITEEMMDEE